MQVNHWCRVVMNQEVRGRVLSMEPNKLSALEISGQGWSDAGFQSYRSVQYPGFDICADQMRRSYDIIFAEQVLEHVRYPVRACRNVYGMLRKNGVFVVTVPFLIKYHPSPLDLWRWTSEGLKAMLEDAGFEVVEAYSWGNAACVSANLGDWVFFDRDRHSLADDPDFPLVVWAFARRTTSRTPVEVVVAAIKNLRRKWRANSTD